MHLINRRLGRSNNECRRNSSYVSPSGLWRRPHHVHHTEDVGVIRNNSASHEPKFLSNGNRARLRSTGQEIHELRGVAGHTEESCARRPLGSTTA